jgi:acetylglutamate kinase
VSDTIVVKLGGAVLSDEQQLEAIANDVAKLTSDGHSVVVMHGGGPQATRLSEKLGIAPNFVGGRRVTDAETLEICKMVYAGKLSVDLTCALGRAGVKSVGLSGVSSGLINAVKRPPRIVTGGGDKPVDFGHVGDIVGINTDLLQTLLGAGYVPVMNSLGADEAGNPYNINADVAATRVARALQADHLGLLTGGVPGVLRDKDDLSTRIPRLTAAQARQAIDDGIIQGGMIPKVEESLAVIESGVGAIHILGKLEPGDLSAAFEAPGTVGTALVECRLRSLL